MNKDAPPHATKESHAHERRFEEEKTTVGGRAAAPDVVARPRRHRRSGSGRTHLDRKSGPRPPAVVADPSARSDGLWRFALSMLLGVRRQLTARQSSAPDRGWASGRRVRAESRLSRGTCRL